MKLKVHCPQKKGMGFEDMHRRIGRIAERMKALSDKSGVGIPSVILFHESSLKYSFEIRQDEVLSCVDRMQKLLPSDQWVAVAFAVLQNNEGEISNMGYAFTKQIYGFQPKREMSNGDSAAIEKYFGNDISALNWYAGKWEVNAYLLEKSNTPFLEMETPDGQKLEFRICRDITLDRFNYAPEKITLVMADGLPLGLERDFSHLRKGVIVNDAKRGLLVAPKQFSRDMFTLSRYGEKTLSLYETDYAQDDSSCLFCNLN